MSCVIWPDIKSVFEALSQSDSCATSVNNTASNRFLQLDLREVRFWPKVSKIGAKLEKNLGLLEIIFQYILARI